MWQKRYMASKYGPLPKGERVKVPKQNAYVIIELNWRTSENLAKHFKAVYIDYTLGQLVQIGQPLQTFGKITKISIIAN